MKIVIGLPAYNEEKNIATIISNLQKKSYEIIVCDDGSTDNTAYISEKMGAIVIKHERNKGYGSAIRSLFEKARDSGFDILVTFDADGQHQVEEIEKVIKPITNYESDIVIGSRFLDGNSSQVPKYRKVGIKMITNLVNSETGKKISDSQSGFRAYSKKVFQKIQPSENGMGVSTEILIKSNKEKFRISEVPIKINYEGDTSTHNPVSHGASVILSTMKFISIEHPLQFYGIPGIIFLAVGLFFIVWTLQEFSETRRIITNISLIGIGSTILGMIMMMTSIILYSIVNVVREK